MHYWDMPSDEVDDTELTPAEFRAAVQRGERVRIITNREDYLAELRRSLADRAVYVANVHLSLALVRPGAEPNMPARAAS